MKSRAVFILAVALENWNIYDSVLKQEGRRLFPFLDVASHVSNSDVFLRLPLPCCIPSTAVSLSRGLFAAQSPSLRVSQAMALEWEGNVTLVYLTGTISSHLP